MKFAMSTGGKPGALHTVFTTDAAQVLEDAGEDPLLHKRPEGGLASELCPQRAPGCTRAKGLYVSIVFRGVLCMHCAVFLLYSTSYLVLKRTRRILCHDVVYSYCILLRILCCFGVPVFQTVFRSW